MRYDILLRIWFSFTKMSMCCMVKLKGLYISLNGRVVPVVTGICFAADSRD